MSPTKPAPSGPRRIASRWVGLLLVAPFLLYVLTFLILPLASVVVLSTHQVNDQYHVEPAWTLDNYRRVLDPENLPILLRSARYAGLTSFFCLLAGYPLAWFIARHGGRHKALLLLLVMLPFWTSYLVRIFSWMTLLQTEGLLNGALLGLGVIHEPLGLLNTPFSVVLGLTYGFLPFATLPLYVALERLDGTLLEAAADLGARPATTFWKVVFPLSLPGVVAGGLLTFVPAMGDFVTPEILGGVDTLMIGNLIQQQFLASYDWPFGSALSLVLMGLMLVSILAFLKLVGSTESLA
jgi:spermidine/putrescine transport system permease protein